MPYPALLRQPDWVLESASADRTNTSQLTSKPNAAALKSWRLIEPGWLALEKGDRQQAERAWRMALTQNPNDLLLARAVNQHSPHLLEMQVIRRREALWRNRIAVIIPGELRCLNQSKHFFQALSRSTDLFVCTSSDFAGASDQLPAKVEIIDQEPSLSVGSMHQWHKLARCLAMVRKHEVTRGQRYTHLLKLRTDYHHIQPKRLIKELVNADGLICASDKVFGGSRELMLLFEGFYAALHGWFDEHEQSYWPINCDTILKSDDSVKWYGMSFPRALIGQPNSVNELRSILLNRKQALSKKLQQWRPPTKSDPTNLYWRLFQGHPRFASEICFARFLNFNAIAAHSSAGTKGFLRSDRLKQ